MGMWGRLALVAAGAVIGVAATRLGKTMSTEVRLRSAGDVHRTEDGAPVPVWRQRIYDFAAVVKEGMDEREAELKENFGVRTPQPPAPPAHVDSVLAEGNGAARPLLPESPVPPRSTATGFPHAPGTEPSND